MRHGVVAMVGVLVVALVVSACAGKYADVKKVNGRFVKVTEAYISDLDGADSAKDVAKAMNSYADEMEKIWPQMQKLNEKYPELRDQENPPKELVESKKQAEATGMKMAATFMKIMPYMNDPAVRKAQERQGEIMTQ